MYPLLRENDKASDAATSTARRQNNVEQQAGLSGVPLRVGLHACHTRVRIESIAGRTREGKQVIADRTCRAYVVNLSQATSTMSGGG